MELPKSFSVSGRIPLTRYSLTQQRKKKQNKTQSHSPRSHPRRGGVLPRSRGSPTHLPFPPRSGTSDTRRCLFPAVPRVKTPRPDGERDGERGRAPPLGSRPDGLSVSVPSRPPPASPVVAGGSALRVPRPPPWEGRKGALRRRRSPSPGAIIIIIIITIITVTIIISYCPSRARKQGPGRRFGSPRGGREKARRALSICREGTGRLTAGRRLTVVVLAGRCPLQPHMMLSPLQRVEGLHAFGA